VTFDARAGFPGSAQLLAGPDGRVIASRVVWARSRGERRRGLLDLAQLQAGEGLVIEHAVQVHTFGMRYSIDVVFCDKKWVVRHILHELAPARFTRFVLRSRYAIELPAGAAAGLHRGDRLCWLFSPTSDIPD